MKRIIPLLVIAIAFSFCKKDDVDPALLSNKEKMNLLVIPDPLVWNSLAEQSMHIDTTAGPDMKGTTGVTKQEEYPKKGYYFTMFEDLYPSQGDYDFNDVMLQSKYIMDFGKKTTSGTIITTVFNRGGTLSSRLGLMFYSVDGNSYEVLDNQIITVNDQQLVGESAFTMDLPATGVETEITFSLDFKAKNINNVWISFFLIVTSNDSPVEIHSAGFASQSNRKFEIPQMDYLTANYLPWGIELEAEEFAIPLETELFLNAYPEFQEWAESSGVKNKKWYENPDPKYVK